ncbi:MAG TPA: hypothetical protein VL633_13165 [Bacteroidota bacterium]|jgi:hypothetical protein|nr:hypothetical protein [Bacteroidota bacterium]
MNGIFSFLLLCIALAVSGCCSSKTVQKSGEASTDTTKAAVPTPAPRQAIVQNVSRVDAVIEAINLIDKAQYSLKIFVLKSEPVTGKFSLIEPEQRVTVYAQFTLIDNGAVVDTANVKNQKLLALRTANVGESFRGKISIDQKGLWRLLEVEDR